MTETATLQLPRDLIVAAIEKEVNLAIARALGEHSRILDTVIQRVLTMKVDSEGKPGHGYSNDQEFILWAVNDALRNAVKEAINTEVQKYKETIRSHLAEQLSRKNSPLLKQLVDQMTTGIIDSTTNKWTLTVKYMGKE